MGFEKDYLIQTIKKMTDEEIKNLLFSIRWGYLSLDEITNKRKKLEKEYESYLNTLDYPFINTKKNTFEEIKKNIKYQEQLKLLNSLERDSQQNKLK